MKTNERINEATAISADSVAFILKQLAAESAFLDDVIESCLQMQTIVRDGRNSRAENSSSKARQEGSDPISGLRQQLEQRFEPIQQGRQQMLNLIASLPLPTTVPRTAAELARRVEEPERGQLIGLRAEIRSKFNRIQAICMGNQALLVYTLDFYNRLLAGLSRQPVGSAGYDATGATTNPSITRLPGNIVQTRC